MWAETEEDKELYGEAVGLGCTNEIILSSKWMTKGFITGKKNSAPGNIEIFIIKLILIILFLIFQSCIKCSSLYSNTWSDLKINRQSMH